MSLSRIKSIVIAMLLLINAFFLTIIVFGKYADARDERQELEDLCAILQSNGITISPDSVKSVDAIRTMRTARGVEQEAIVANALLDQSDMTVRSSIYLYENAERGSAEFSSGGDFKIWMHEGIMTNASGTLKTVQEILRNMRLEISMFIVSVEPDTEMVVAVSAYRGASIFNCTVDFVFENGSLITVAGRYVTGFEPAEDGVEISSVGTALMGFLAAVKREDIECTEIQSVEAGYIYSIVGSFGEGVISPVWMVTTSNGRHVVDSATGEIRLI